MCAIGTEDAPSEWPFRLIFVEELPGKQRAFSFAKAIRLPSACDRKTQHPALHTSRMHLPT